MQNFPSSDSVVLGISFLPTPFLQGSSLLGCLPLPNLLGLCAIRNPPLTDYPHPMTGGVNTLAWQYISPLDSLAWQYFYSCSSYLSSYSFLSGPVLWSNSCLVTSFSFFFFFHLCMPLHLSHQWSNWCSCFPLSNSIVPLRQQEPTPYWFSSSSHWYTQGKTLILYFNSIGSWWQTKLQKIQMKEEILAYRQLLQYFFICLLVSRELADIVLAGMCTEAECLFVIYLCNSWLYTVILCSFFRVHCGSAERVVVVTGVWTRGWCPVFAHCVAHWTHRQVLNEGVLGYLGHPFFPYRK